MIRIAIYVWAALSVISLSVYAFTGLAAWTQMDPRTDGGLRFVLLFLIHIGWIPALAAVLESKQ